MKFSASKRRKLSSKGSCREAIKLYARAEEISKEGKQYDLELARLLSQETTQNRFLDSSVIAAGAAEERL